VVFSHYPPVDELAAERLRDATVAWAPLLGELHGPGSGRISSSRRASETIR
jgi:hypothetical protein